MLCDNAGVQHLAATCTCIYVYLVLTCMYHSYVDERFPEIYLVSNWENVQFGEQVFFTSHKELENIEQSCNKQN